MQAALIVQRQLALVLLQLKKLLQLLVAWHTDVCDLVVQREVLHCGCYVDLGPLRAQPHHLQSQRSM